MTKQINLVINGKGGLGKSFFATNVVQYLKIAASIITPSIAIMKTPHSSDFTRNRTS